MNSCVNHPEREALSFCHNCGESFCEECLTEGTEYYYCQKPECQSMLAEELAQPELPEVIVCPFCNIELELSEKEKTTRKVHCTECDSLIDFNADPPVVMGKDNYVELYRSVNWGDIGIIKSLLDDAGISYYVFGENFLGADPLIQPARFFVDEKQAEEAAEILKGMDLKIFGTSMNDYKGEE